MRKKIYSTICALVLAGVFVGSSADAATVSVLPSSSNVLSGDAIILDIKGSGFLGNADAGGFMLTWKSSVLSYTGIALSNPPWDTTFVDDTDEATGTLNTVFLGTSALGGTGPDFDVAKVSFNVIGVAGDSTTVAINSVLLGWAAPGAIPIAVSYNNADVNVVPIPGAAYLLFSGFAGLVGLARKRKVTTG